MSTQSRKIRKSTDRGDYGFARARDAAFDAVSSLWYKRRKSGMKQSDLALILNRDPGWVCTQLKGPGNWTLRTFGEFVEAMDGEVEIKVFGREDPVDTPSNYDAYAAHESSNASANTSRLVFTSGKPNIQVGSRPDPTRTRATTEFELAHG